MCLRPSCSGSSTSVRPAEESITRNASDRGRTVLELHAGPQPLPDCAGDRGGHLGDVGLDHTVRRMGQPVREIPVVGQDQQALGLGVQPPDVEQPPGRFGHQVTDAGPTVRVGHRGDHAARLVHRQVDAGPSAG